MIISTHPLIQLSTEFAELCSPLEDFGITHLTYQKQYLDGSRVSLSNKPQWIADYYNHCLYKSSLFESSPKIYRPEFCVWIGDYDLEVYQHGKQYYNTTHSITISMPVHDGCEFFLFSSPPESIQSIHYLANNRDILYHFIMFVKDRGNKLFLASANSRIIVPEIPLLKNQPLSPLISGQDNYKKMDLLKKQFYNKTVIRKYIFETGGEVGSRLTQRELQCLHCLLRNKTADETASIMNISRRTVESYLENIKIKLNCNSKSDLLRKLQGNILLEAL